MRKLLLLLCLLISATSLSAVSRSRLDKIVGEPVIVTMNAGGRESVRAHITGELEVLFFGATGRRMYGVRLLPATDGVGPSFLVFRPSAVKRIRETDSGSFFLVLERIVVAPRDRPE